MLKTRNIYLNRYNLKLKNTPYSVEGSLVNPAEESKEPGIIDIDKIYTEYEEELNKEIRQQKGPDGLNLKNFDINLRSHRIVAGIYCVEYLEQPHQDTKTNCRTFLRTVTHPNNLKRKEFHQPYKPPEPVAPGVRRLPEEIEAELKQVEANLDRLASITIKSIFLFHFSMQKFQIFTKKNFSFF